MNKTTSDLITIARAGGGLRLDASSKTTSDLITIARALSDGSQLFLYSTDNKTTSDLITIARAAGNRVVFEM